jgi:hypothetical protein
MRCKVTIKMLSWSHQRIHGHLRPLVSLGPFIFVHGFLTTLSVAQTIGFLRRMIGWLMNDELEGI